MSVLANRVRVNTATAGTGTVTLGAVTSAAFFTLTEAGVADGTTVSYVLEDGSNVELGIGVTGGTGTTCTRATVTASKIGGTAGTTKLTLSGSAVWYIDALAADITVPPASSTDNAIARYDGTTGRAIQNSVLTIGDDGKVRNTTPLTFDTEPIILYLTDAGVFPAIVFEGANAGGGPFFNFYHNSATPAAFDTLGGFAVYANNSAAAPIAVAGFLAQLDDPTAGSEDSSLVMSNRVAGTYIPASICVAANGIGIYTGLPVRRLHVVQDSSATNTVTYVERITSTSTGTPAVGIGAGMEFEVEVQAAVNKVGSTVEAYAYNVGAGTEGFETVFKTMSAGAAATEKGRTGFMPVNMIQNDSLTLLASNSMVVSSRYTIPTGVALTLGADSVMRIL